MGRGGGNARRGAVFDAVQTDSRGLLVCGGTEGEVSSDIGNPGLCPSCEMPPST